MGLSTRHKTFNELHDDSPNLLFQGFSTPSSVSQFITSAILNRLGSLETMYDTWSRCNTALRLLSQARLAAWRRIDDALSAEYNPVHNYDRSDSESESVETAGSGTTTTESAATSTDTSQDSGTDTTTFQHQSYNISGFQDADRQQLAHGMGNETSREQSADGSSSQEVSETTERTRTLTSSGNIGVTTAQEMITQELTLRQQNLCDIIVDDVKFWLCVGVW